MASIKCGHCEQTHGSVQEVRECHTNERFQRHANMGQAFGAGHGREGVLGSYAAVDASHPSQPEPVEIAEGFWTLDGSFYKVQKSQTSGHLYAKILDVGPGVEGAPETSWEYSPGAIGKLRNGGATPLTEDEAARFGKLYGVCLLCGRTLTNEDSIARGIGPICAGKQGW